jgi:hypothetical protein
MLVGAWYPVMLVIVSIERNFCVKEIVEAVVLR